MPPRKREAAGAAKGRAPRATRAASAEAPLSAPVARVERPVSLDQVVGHASTKAVLQAALAAGRVHHAWIFAGDQGVGKFTLALALGARLLLPPEDHPDHDRLKDLLRAGAHPDLHVVTKELASHSREDSVRRQKQTTLAKAVIEEFLIEPLQRTRQITTPSPVGKVFIVDEAELIDPVGQNTMLKTLEEPPEGTVVILVTSVESRLLPTIRSRCQRAVFNPLTDKELAAHLRSRFAEVAPAQLEWVVAYARGSLGRAALAIEQGLYAWHAELAPMLDAVAAGKLAPALGPAMGKQVEARAEAAVKARPDSSKDAANRLWSRRLLGYVAEHYRAGMARGGPRAVWAARAVDLCRDAERQVESNVAFATALDNLAAQLMTPEG